MDVKEILRWMVRRDADAGATMLGGLINNLQPFIATVVGVNSGIENGIGVFIGLFVVKCVAGRVDLILGATKYRNHYVSSIAPMNVKIIDKEIKDDKSVTS